MLEYPIRTQLSSQSVDCRLLQTLSVCLSVCMCLSLFYGLYLAYYVSGFDQIWLKYWNLGPIDCSKISLRYAARVLR